MKKLKKLSALALLAVGFALVFGGCKNSSGGSTDTDDDKKNDDTTLEETAKTGVIIGDKVYAFSEMEVINQYNGKLSDAVDSDGNLKIAAQSYGFTYIILSKAIDVSSYEKIIISAKKSDDWKNGGSEETDTTMIFEVASGNIENYGNDNEWEGKPAPWSLRYTDTACGVSSWTGDKGYFDGKDLTTTFKDFEILIEDFELLKANSVYVYKPKTSSKDAEKLPTKPADTSAIKEFAVFPRNNNGTLYIQSIKFE